jgi:hypothetical protein
MKVLILLACLTAALAAADHVWQSGTLRDPTGQTLVKPGATYAVPLGATTIFLTDPPEAYVMIDAPDGISYVASRKGSRKALPLVINDRVTFAIEGDALYVRLGNHDTKYKIVKRIRRP